MRKILFAFAITISLLLVACTEITDDYNKAQQPSIELKYNGELLQHYEENIALEDVEFEVTFKQFSENNISMDDVTINWFVRDQLIEDYTNLTKIVQTVNSAGVIPIRVEVLFTLDGKNEVLEANQLIEVVRTETIILVTNSADPNNHRVNVTVGEDNEVEFTARITGNLNLDFKWAIFRETMGEPELIEEIDLGELTVTNNVGTAKLTYTFPLSQGYIVRIHTGDGLDANVRMSNSTYVNVRYGLFELSTPNKKVLSEREGFTNRILTVNQINESSIGAGTYEWYLNGEKIDNDNKLTYTHNDLTLGSFLYQVKFVPNNNEIEPIETEPVLIINGREVSNEAELLAALTEQVGGIILTDDIQYVGDEVNGIRLNYPVGIYGNGHELSSYEIDIFINITSDNVHLSNMKITRARKYNILFSNVEGGYLENIQISELGGGDVMEMARGEDFGSGVYILRSEVQINNIEFLDGGLVGIRIEGILENKSNLRINGQLIYNNQDPIVLPIGSGSSPLDGIELIASGFDYFALPAGEITIRRWDNQGDPVQWEILPQDKTKYEVGEYLDLFGIGINVDIGFLNLPISNADGLTFVEMYINMFNEFGTVEITNMNDEVIDTYYIIGFNGEETYGLDNIIYSKTNDLVDGVQVRPDLPNEPGLYKIKIYVSDTFYLGHVVIEITE